MADITSGGTWYCQKCGAYGHGADTHECYHPDTMAASVTMNYVWSIKDQDTNLSRIAAALERIAAALEGKKQP